MTVVHNLKNHQQSTADLTLTYMNPVNRRDVLALVRELPLSTWNLKTDDTKARHLGPMAQDFYAAFGLGDDERHIAPLDVAGVALAAIQEIEEEKDAQIEALNKRLSALEELISSKDVISDL